MPRSRPASKPLSFHKPTGQFYVTRGGRRVYLGADEELALEKYHRLALGCPAPEKPTRVAFITVKELANRFLATQKANWRNPEATLHGYSGWLARFLEDHPGLRADQLTVEMLAAWKLSLRERQYSPRSINHYLGAIRAAYRFGEDTGLLETVPRFRRVKNEPAGPVSARTDSLYKPSHIQALLSSADLQVRLMLFLGLNCGFGPKDIQDLTWHHVDGDRVTLPRSKTGVCQTFLLWAETRRGLEQLRQARAALIQRLALRKRDRTDQGHVFVTKYWRPWNKDAVAEQFRKLCKKAGVPCYGFYRLRHCASTAMSLVANPHVQRKFMRHSQLQQQVTYTHTPDAEVDAAIVKAREKLLGPVTEGSESDREQVGAA